EEVARKRKGQSLSLKYVSARKSMSWRCSRGHIWDATFDSIKAGSWCPTCYGSDRSNLEEMQRLAKWNGGRCLSRVYIDDETSVLWKCAAGHKWRALPNGIKAGRWCPECAVARKRGMKKPVYGIEDMQEAAGKQGGECLSTE